MTEKLQHSPSVRGNHDIECPLFFKLQVFLRRHLQQPDLDAENNAVIFMRQFWLRDAEEAAPAAEEDDTETRRRYEAHTANHPTIHANRFPAWSELTDDERNDWRAAHTSAERETS